LPASSTAATQLPLHLRFPPEQRLDTFVGMEHVPALMAGFASGIGPAAVYVTGPPGSGKTHLLLAACAHARQLRRDAVYLPLAAAAGQLPRALDGLERADLVALDGLHAVIGQCADELALFDLHNRLRDAGKQVCYSANAAPDAWPALLPDLRSRLNHCARITLPVLDDAGRADVLRRRAAARGLQMEPGAIDWLLRRHSRGLTDLLTLIDRLDRASLAEQRRVTIPFLRRYLAAEPAGQPAAAATNPGQ